MSELKQDLSLTGLTMIAVGSCIGVGIFMTPAQVASHLGNANLIFLVWAIGGAMALTGALTFAELGGLFPKTGGVYVFLKEAYGDLIAFLYGWVILLVITSGALAALSLAFAHFLNFIIPIPEPYLKFIAIFLILFLAVINMMGIKIGDLFSKIFSGLKLLGILFIVLVAVFVSNSEARAINFGDLALPDQIGPAIAAALVGVFFSFGGWHHTSYLAGETKKPEKNIPKAMIIGASIVTVAYLLVNLAYLLMLPMEEIAASNAIAADSMNSVFKFGAIIVATIIVLSTFGTIGIYTITAPRIYFAMAKDKIFFKSLAKIHPKYKTPASAIFIQAIWTCVLILFWGTFASLIEYVVFMDWIFMTLAAISIFIFRKKLSSANRPYKTLGYPIVPLIFIGISVWFIYQMLQLEHEDNAIINNPILIALIVAFLGLPVYFFFKFKKQKELKK
jgi:APA family basic amino acid/polyamine antiporter